MNKKELVHQTKLAFDFIQKLYYEVSYLIKEVEGLLAEEDERFIIGRTGGYAITSRSSSSLESNQVSLWLLRKLSVFFVAEEFSKYSGGVTQTKFDEQLKLIYLRIVLDEKDIAEPFIHIGVLYDFVDKHKKWPTKFEHLMGHMEYNETKVFRDGERLDYEDGYTKFMGRFVRVNLYDINSSEDIVNHLLVPVLKLYREV